MKNRQIYCQCEYSNNLPPIQADMSQLSKAFNNLIRNAMQAMLSGGKLSVKVFSQEEHTRDTQRLAVKNGWITLEFQDTGIGISPEDIKNIFTPFFTTKDIGTGLGLAITYKVITEHGGRIDVESNEGKGSLFRIYLPV